jgi:biotin carboxyl carrier protein
VKYIATVNGRDLELDIDRQGEVTVDGEVRGAELRLVDGVSLYSLIMDASSYEVFVEREAGDYVVLLGGQRYVVDVDDARLKRLRDMGGQPHEERGAARVLAPMPGMVVKLLVSPGDKVEADQGLLILEAMKMENEIRAPRSGSVRSVGVEPGQTVNDGDVLVVIDEPA